MRSSSLFIHSLLPLVMSATSMAASVANRPSLTSTIDPSQGLLLIVLPPPGPQFERPCPHPTFTEIPRTDVHRNHHIHRHRPDHLSPDRIPLDHHPRYPNRTLRRQPPRGHDGRYLVDRVAVTAGDKIESLRQWASARCLSVDWAAVYSRPERSGTRARRAVREPGVN